MSSPFRYRFISVVGEGGFGRVYRARLETDEGFAKDVAIKVLSDPKPQQNLLQRFRDEARILGLLRDRAIVSAEPPIQIGGRWAVVMEFVDGVSLAAMLDKDGPVPPKVALEIIEEIARALHHAFHMEGPDGQPLQLLHRDIKPENIQLTPSGEVRILDFGIARAVFENREFRTKQQFGGTPGYIAPERTKGIELPTGDVFSLGVVLHEMLTLLRPSTAPTVQVDPATLTIRGNHGELSLLPEQASDKAMVQASLLAAWMRADDPGTRPSAREVETWCRKLRQDMSGPYLREWAEKLVPHRNDLEPDGMVGQVLTRMDAGPSGSETFDGFNISVDVPTTGTVATDTRTVALGAVLGTGFTLLFFLFALVLAIGGWWVYYSQRDPSPPPLATTEREPPALSEVVKKPPPVVDLTKEADVPNPTPLAKVKGTKPGPAPTRRKEVDLGGPTPDPAPVVHMTGLEEPAPRPARPTGKLVVRSVPSGATVIIDDQPVEHRADGTYELPYSETPHWLVLRSPSGEVSPRTPIRISVGKSVPYCWDFDRNQKCDQ